MHINYLNHKHEYWREQYVDPINPRLILVHFKCKLKWRHLELFDWNISPDYTNFLICMLKCLRYILKIFILSLQKLSLIQLLLKGMDYRLNSEERVTIKRFNTVWSISMWDISANSTKRMTMIKCNIHLMP